MKRALFFRHLAVSLRSGLPLERALAIGKSEESAGLLREVRRGKPLHEAMLGQPFDATERALVRVGESTGQLPEMLELLAHQLEEARAFRNQVLSGIAYPLFMVIVAILVLPLPVLFSCAGLGGYLPKVLPPLGTFTLVLAGLGWGSQRPAMKAAFVRAAGALPGIGGILKKISLLRYATMLGYSQKAGLSPSLALRLAGDASLDASLKKASLHAALAAEHGRPLSEAFLRFPQVFPPDFLAVVQTGEETGCLDELLLQQASRWKEELGPLLKGLSHWLVRLGTLFVMLLVGLQVVEQAKHSSQQTEQQIREIVGE
ncbi:MAG: type II secretion system F family protein [Bacteroidota bacterium]